MDDVDVDVEKDKVTRQEFRHDRPIVFLLKAHLFFSPKYRGKVLLLLTVMLLVATFGLLFGSAVDSALAQSGSCPPTPSTPCTLTGHDDIVISVAFSPDGKMLASGSADNTIKLWNVVTCQCVDTLTGHDGDVTSVAFSPEGKLLASGSWDNTIKLWNVATCQCIDTLTGNSLVVRSVAFNPEGKLLASSGSWDSTIKLWNVATRQCVDTLTGHDDSVNSVAFSPEGKLLASGSDDYTIKLWNVATCQCVDTLAGHGNSVNSVAFSPEGKLLASGSWGSIKLWNVATRQCVDTLTGHDGGVTSVAFSPEGKLLASGSRDNTIKLWNVAICQCIDTLTGHDGYVRSVAFSPEGKLLASCSWDSTIKLWNVANEAGDKSIECGETVEGVISDEQESEWWTFEVDPETLVTVSMVATSGYLDTYLELYSADGLSLFSDDDSGEHANSLITDLWLPLGGSYEIEASRYSGEGSYTLCLSCSDESPGQPIKYGQTLTGTIDNIHPSYAYIFEGNVGDQVRINMSDAGAGTLDSYVLLFGPDGGLMDFDNDCGDNYNAWLDGVLPGSGVYRLVLTRPGNDFGGWNSYGNFIASLELVTLPPEAVQVAEELYSEINIDDTSQVLVIGPVDPGTIILENTPINDYERKPVNLSVPDVSGEYYVFFIDDEPEFRFSHPVRYAWLDLVTGKHEVLNASLLPLIGSRDGAPYVIELGGSGFVNGIQTVYGHAHMEYSNATEDSSEPQFVIASVNAKAPPTPKKGPAKKVALVIDGGDSPSLKGPWYKRLNRLAVNHAWCFYNSAHKIQRKWLDVNGYQVLRYSQYKKRHKNLESADPSKKLVVDLEKIISDIADDLNKITPTKGHHEFFFYFSGHGSEGGISLCHRDYSKDWEIYEYDRLEKNLSKFDSNNIDLTIFIDTCYSGSAVLPYRNGLDQPALPRLCNNRKASVTIVTATDVKNETPVGGCIHCRDSATEDFLEVSGDIKKRWQHMRSETGHGNPQFCTCKNRNLVCAQKP